MSINPKAAARSLYYQACDEDNWYELRNDNKEALAVIYYRFFSILLQRGLQISSDRELVKDCIHDLFLEIWVNKISLATPLSVKAYLIVSIQRKIFSRHKIIRSRQTEMDRLPLENVNSKEDQIISEQQINDQQCMVIRALNSLSRRQKEAIRLKFFANMSYEEISGMMNISTDSIYNLVSKAINNLQKGLIKETELTIY